MMILKRKEMRAKEMENFAALDKYAGSCNLFSRGASAMDGDKETFLFTCLTT